MRVCNSVEMARKRALFHSLQQQFQSQLTEQSMDISRIIWSLNIRLVRTDRDSFFFLQADTCRCS